MQITRRIALLALLLGTGPATSGCSSRHVGSDADGAVDSATMDATVDAGEDGAIDGALDATVDGGTDSGVECGDPAVLARYPSCLAAQDEVSCLAAGGSWGVVGLAPYPECQCPTGQAACPCSRSGDCRSSCIAELLGDCSTTPAGHCSAVSITVGCYCYFLEDGQVEDMCVD